MPKNGHRCEKVKIEIELCSDALPGSGEAGYGNVDRDVIFDEYGIPYIPAKRFKGVLRSKGCDLQDFGMLSRPNLIDEIFGADGGIETRFHISNGYLEEYTSLRLFLEFVNQKATLQQVFNIHNILDFFSYSRPQTAINKETNVALDGSLRYSRVLKKGLKFSFEVELSPEYLPDLELICKVTRHFGGGQTRGLGEIKATFKNTPETAAIEDKTLKSLPSINGNAESDFYRIPVSITNLHQLLVSNLLHGGQESEEFIRGSYLKGVLAFEWIKLNKLKNPHKDPLFQELFLNEKVLYSNSYPQQNEQSFLPWPASLIQIKHGAKYFDLAFTDDFEAYHAESLQSRKVTGFVSIEEGYLQGFRTPMRVEYHHRRPKDRSIGHVQAKGEDPYAETGTFYSYDVMDARNEFVGDILGSKSSLEKILSSIPPNLIVYLGKSKTAQYGKSVLTFGSIEPVPESNITFDPLSITITLTSDMILLNENGISLPDPHFFRAEIEKFLALTPHSVKIKKTFLKRATVGGFMSTWRLPKLQYQAIGAGSVLNIEIPNININDLRKLERHSFGLRQSEGYGRLKINWHGHSSLKLHPPFEFFSNLDVSYPEKTRAMIQFILLSRFRAKIRDFALEKAQTFKGKPQEIPTRTFTQRIHLFGQNSKDFSGLTQKFSDLKTRGQNNLEKITKELYITKNTEKLNTQKQYEINQKQFCGDLKQIFDANQIPGLIDNVLVPAKISPDFWEPKLFEYYIFYFNSFLVNLNYIIRQIGIKEGSSQ
jgi:CRISPR-associated protein Csx10